MTSPEGRRRPLAVAMAFAIGASLIAVLASPAEAARGAVVETSVAVGDPSTGMLEARLSVTEPTGSAPQVVARFSLTNTDAVPLAVLRRDTPLAGMRSDLFRVTRDGQPVAYVGPVAKQGAPTMEDYVVLDPGEATSVELDLRGGYAIDDAGTYTVSLPLVLPDVRRGGAAIAAPIDPASATTVEATLPGVDVAIAQAPSGSSGGNPVANGFSGCTGPEQTSIQTAYPAAQAMVADAVTKLQLATSPATAARYLQWFGAHTPTRYSLVQAHYAAEQSFLTTNLVANVPWSCNDSGCSPTTYAYVYPNDPTHGIHLCGAFFSAPISGADSRPGTLIHELSHFVDIAGTDDYAYGTSAAGSLAASNPAQATMNADNHEYFAENPTNLTVGNLRPSATAQSVTAQVGTTTTITLAGTDPDGNPLTYSVGSGPSHGTFTGTGTTRQYTPTAPFASSDSFTFVVNDGQADSAPATVAITIDPADPVLKPGVGSVTEGDAGDVTLNVPIDLLTPSTETVTVAYQTFANSGAGVATVGTDVAATSGTLTFLPGQTHKEVALTVHGDEMYEPPLAYGEWALVLFNGATNATVDTSLFGLGIGVIIDDDPVPTMVPGAAGVTEGATGTTTVVQVPITLSNPSQLPVTVSYQTFDNGGTGVATAGADYVATSGTVTFLPGETTKTVAVTVKGDALDEPPLVYGEWILVQFTGATNATLDLSFFGLGIGAIVDDD